MSIWTFLTGGLSLTRKKTWGERITYQIGYWLANRHSHVNISPTCLISPETKVSPREGQINIGDNTTVAAGAIIQGNVDMGKHCSVQSYSILVGYGDCQKREGLIKIGNYVRIAPQVMMIAANHVFSDPDQPIHDQGLNKDSIIIEDDVWIGGRVNIMAGVTIGKGSVIGAGTVVTHDIPPYSIAVGVPARVIKKRK